MNFENLNRLIEEHKKETHPYKRYEFDSTSYTLLLIDINNLVKENQELKKQNNNFKTSLDESQEVILDYIKENQEFIKFLEDNYNLEHDIWYIKILQKYKEIIGVSDENN